MKKLFELNEIQQEVFEGYRRFCRIVENSEGRKDVLKEPKRGFFRRIVLQTARFVQFNSNRLFRSSKTVTDFERQAEEITGDPKFEEIFGETLQKRIAPDFFKEEIEVEVVRVVTTVLARKLSPEGLTNDDKILYGMITYKLMQKRFGCVNAEMP